MHTDTAGMKVVFHGSCLSGGLLPCRLDSQEAGPRQAFLLGFYNDKPGSVGDGVCAEAGNRLLSPAGFRPVQSVHS